MDNESSSDISRWYSIYTHPKQEERAASNLRAWGVKAFNPKLKERGAGTRSPARLYVTKPLFPRYIFARFKAAQLLRKVFFTRGVHSVVSYGDSPTRVDDDVIAIIQSRMGEDGFVSINEELRAGDSVIIKDGPFKGIMGLFDRAANDAERVAIMLTVIGSQARVIVDRDLVEKTALSS